MDNKVICRYCEHEMELDRKTGVSAYVDGHWDHKQPTNYRCECGAESPIANGPDSAYLAATRRPPNLPLAKEQIKGMLHTNALWLIRKGEVAGVFVGSVLSVLCSLDSYHKNYHIFAANPTTADIESARNAANTDEKKVQFDGFGY